MFRCNTLKDSREAERQLVQENHRYVAQAARSAVGAEGGQTVVSATGSIDVFFPASVFPVRNQPQLPFLITVAGQVLVFDEVEPSPVFEVGGDTIAPSVSESFCDDPICPPVDAQQSNVPHIVEAKDTVLVEADATASFEVDLPRLVLKQVLSRCAQCFGYTLLGNRCKNLRRPLDREDGIPVWCNHHRAQQREYQRFRATRARPSDCTWWDQFLYDEVVN